MHALGSIPAYHKGLQNGACSDEVLEILVAHVNPYHAENPELGKNDVGTA